MTKATDEQVQDNQAIKIVPELLSTKQAAELCGIGERTLWRWSHCGLAPKPISIGIGLRPARKYRRSELTDWIDSGCPRVDGAEEGGGR